MARPKRTLDVRQLETLKALAAIGCTVPEMAQVMGVSKRTLERSYLEKIEAGRLERNVSLRRKQYQLAMQGDKTMLIWLGKQLLGQGEKSKSQPPELTDGHKLIDDTLSRMPDEELDRELRTLMQKLRL
jgi:hypothetical protein